MTFSKETWEAEKRSVAFTSSLWEQRDNALELIITLASGSDGTARKARDWLLAKTDKKEVKPWLIDLVESFDPEFIAARRALRRNVG